MSPIGDLANSTLIEVKCSVGGGVAILYFYGEPLVLVLKNKLAWF
jgi:hypothetical protein